MSKVSTSVDTLKSIAPKAPSRKERVLALVIGQSGIGTNRTQIAKELDINVITVGSILTELTAAGKIRRKGETIIGLNGKPEHLYVKGSGIPVTKVQEFDCTLSQERLVALLKTFGVTKSTVNQMTWRDQSEGWDFWNTVYLELDK